jgi:hypothetical protein
MFAARVPLVAAFTEATQAAHLQAILDSLVEERWKVDCDRLWLAIAPHIRKKAFLPKADQNREEWYREQYEAQAKRDAEIAAAEQDPARHPGREFRAGRAPEHLYEQQPQRSKRSKRIGTNTQIREGELFPHPGDTESLWPGVSAGHSDRRLPQFSGGGLTTDGSYVWLPLARRVDLDRVLNTLLQREDSFQNTKAIGAGHASAIVVAVGALH